MANTQRYKIDIFTFGVIAAKFITGIDFTDFMIEQGYKEGIYKW